jgi:hypothetical protein
MHSQGVRRHAHLHVAPGYSSADLGAIGMKTLPAPPPYMSLDDDSASDKAHYVTLARRVFPGVRTLAYGQTATVRGEASDALCCLMYSVRCTRQEAPLPRSALDVLKERQDALLLGG